MNSTIPSPYQFYSSVNMTWCDFRSDAKFREISDLSILLVLLPGSSTWQTYQNGAWQRRPTGLSGVNHTLATQVWWIYNDYGSIGWVTRYHANFLMVYQDGSYFGGTEGVINERLRSNKYLATPVTRMGDTA